MSAAMMSAAFRRGCLKVVGNVSGNQSSRSLIGRAAVAGIKFDPRLGNSCNGSRTDAPADQAVNAIFDEYIESSNMAVAACGLNKFAGDDSAVFDRIDFEDLGHAEVLVDVVVFERNGDFHDGFSLTSAGRRCPTFGMARSRTVRAVFPEANSIMAAGDHKRLCVDDGVGNFKARLFIDFRYCCARNFHLCCALFVRALFKVDDAKRFVFINVEDDARPSLIGLWQKFLDSWFGAYAPAPSRSWHEGFSKLIPTFVGINVIPLARSWQ